MDANAYLGLLSRVEADPIEVDWEVVESHVGIALPSDYKALAAYGPLDIGDFVWLYTPCVQEYEFNRLDAFDYVDWLKQTHRHCRISARNVPPHAPPPFHPLEGGLLAWGRTRRSSYLFWDTSASQDPDRWPVVVFEQDSALKGDDPWLTLNTPLLETLTLILSEGISLPSGQMLGPLLPIARRTRFLRAATPWTPPEKSPERVPENERRAVLTEGAGLTALRLLAPPPEDPYLGELTWEEVFAALGTRLPSEYVELMDVYGTGCFSSWMRFVAPLRGEQYGLIQTASTVSDGYRDLRESFPEDFPLAVWPEPGGFLAFANSIDGDELGWLTQGDPDQWPVIVFPRHDDQGSPLPGTLIETLLDWMRGRLDEAGFASLDPDDDPLEFLGFVPNTADDFAKQERERREWEGQFAAETPESPAQGTA
ncbi:hypothetical protein [Streptosporangium subroseum]|uniref:hypothetical protein n=1 Tax=Streptosporangium subroseum TaxID=106412 RepID=UPI00308AC688|nr:SMI1/KNR4 family protein [Streptosporangium subroseum]